MNNVATHEKKNKKNKTATQKTHAPKKIIYPVNKSNPHRRKTLPGEKTKQ